MNESEPMMQAWWAQRGDPTVTAPDPGTLSEWPCDDYLPPLTCWTTPKPKTLICQGCRASFPDGPKVQRDYERARLAAVPARDDLAAKVEAAIARVETHPVRNTQTRAVTGYMLPADEWRSIRAALRALLADPEPDQEQP